MDIKKANVILNLKKKLYVQEVPRCKQREAWQFFLCELYCTEGPSIPHLTTYFTC